MSSTEDTSRQYEDLDLWSNARILDAIWQGQNAAIASLKPALPILDIAVEAAASRLKYASENQSLGRLAYIGAGTSGLLAMQDAMELTPTFGWPLERLVFMMAGGEAARLLPIGESEDDTEQAQKDADKVAFGPHDVAICVAASGSTPYTLAIAQAAKQRGGLVIAITNNQDTPLADMADHAIVCETGPEVLSGSTRMAAGTAQKAALTALSTLLMTRLGYVVAGRMVNMIVDNEKLRQRASDIVADLSGKDSAASIDALAKADGQIKDAILIARGKSPEEARAMLAAKGEDLRQALAES